MSDPGAQLISFGEASIAPKISVAIPHYKHRRHLEKVLQSVIEQDMDGLEIVVSDDGSPDDSNEVIPNQLAAGGRPYRYYAQQENLGYDGNLRFVISASQGRYVFLLGNDDALAVPQTLSHVFDCLRSLDFPEVAFTDYASWADPQRVTHRASKTQTLGSGPATAIRHFRNLSFVSGLIFDSHAAAVHETDRWDQSVYYQMYLGSRIVSAGGRLAGISVPAVLKDVEIDGQQVGTYRTRWAHVPRSFEARPAGLDSVIRVNADAILPYVGINERSRTLRRLINQLLMTTYPFWLFEYRRVARWSFSVGIARGFHPSRLLAEYQISSFDRLCIRVTYLGASLGGLLFPEMVFRRVSGRLASWLRERRQA